MIKYLIRRILVFIPLAFGIVLVVFVLLRMIPGSPVARLAGTHATQAQIEALTERLGLDLPIWQQFFIYVRNLLQGDMGMSISTSQPVTQDLLTRFPATLELITYTLILCIVIGVFLGARSAINEKGIARKIADLYGLIAGSIADFWIGLMFIYFFFHRLGWAPAPLGRLGIMLSPPERVTGFILVDSVIAGNWETFFNGLSHLFLPVAALTFCFMGAIMKMSRSSITDILKSDFISYARMMGMPKKVIRRYAIRNALPPVITMIGFVYGFLLGGAVLIETVFAWGGLGQYVTQGIAVHDYMAIQGFMIVATIFSMLVYLLVDIAHMAIDPRVKL